MDMVVIHIFWFIYIFWIFLSSKPNTLRVANWYFFSLYDSIPILYIMTAPRRQANTIIRIIIVRIISNRLCIFSFNSFLSWIISTPPKSLDNSLFVYRESGLYDNPRASKLALVMVRFWFWGYCYHKYGKLFHPLLYSSLFRLVFLLCILRLLLICLYIYLFCL